MIDSFYIRKLQTTMLSLGMKQYINKPTRITKDSHTIIIFINNKSEVQIIHEPKITDHAWLKVVLSASTNLRISIKNLMLGIIVSNVNEFIRFY